MMQIPVYDVDDALHDVLERLPRERGPSDLEWLAACARKEVRDARIDTDTVMAVTEISTLLVWLPDGLVSHPLHLLDGTILTQRARAPRVSSTL